jgi:ATP/maltotriose-dependent transcriptional regulator MalT
MSPPWSKPLDIDRLADGQADIDFAVPLAELPRLRSQLTSVEGMVRGRVHFTRESRLVVATLTMSGAATLACQRCLQAMTEPVESSVRVALITAEADASRVPEHLEGQLAPGACVVVPFGKAQAIGYIVTLTEREQAVLRFLPSRLTNQEIGGECFMSVNTVKAHLKAIYNKLGVSSRSDAVERARMLGAL